MKYIVMHRRESLKTWGASMPGTGPLLDIHTFKAGRSGSVRKMLYRATSILMVLLLFAISLPAQVINFSEAAVMASPGIESPVKETAIRVLQEEVEQRTGIRLSQ